MEILEVEVKTKNRCGFLNVTVKSPKRVEWIVRKEAGTGGIELLWMLPSAFSLANSRFLSC